MTAPSFDVHFTAKQSAALRSLANEILYGGAAGGGKSFFMRALAIILCMCIPGLNVYLFRRLSDDLDKNHLEGPSGFHQMLADLVQGGFARIVEREIRFWNGSKIFLCHCQYEKDRFKYQGAEIHVLLIDELTHFTDIIYRYLRGRCRAPGLVIPDWAVAFFRERFGVDLPAKIPLVLCGSNPGNIGHAWVKTAWIDNAAPFEVRQMEKSEGGMRRAYIPALLEDNPNVDAEDYEGKLEGLGSKELVRAMRHGDWSIVAGGYFDCILERKHKLPGLTPPKHWTRFRAMDWGSAHPFSVGWYAIADETVWLSDLVSDLRGKPDRRIPRGALVRYREWYGVKRDENGIPKPNVGLKLSVEAVAKGIKTREEGETIDEQQSRADPSMWKEDGGPSFIERMVGIDNGTGPRFAKADNSRVTGWNQMYTRLEWEGIDDGDPMLFVTEECRDWWRTVPVLLHDEKRMEDVNSEMEDHAGDETRYACMGRPVSRVRRQRDEGPKPWSLDWIIQQDEARQRN